MECGFNAVGDYHSEFDSDAESLSGKAKRQRKEDDYATKRSSDVPTHLNSSQGGSFHRSYKAHHSRAFQEYDAFERQKQRSQFLSLSAFERHKKLVNDYLLYYGGNKRDFGRDSRFDKTDLDVVRENLQFIYDDEKEDGTLDEPSDWGQRIAKRYWDKLFKEYAIADLTHFKTGQIGMRWRTQTEVVSGKGQFQCANKYCQEKEDLQSWEVNFAYKEREEKKNALVKLRLCPTCSMKLNYKKQHKASKPVKKLKELKRKKSSKEHKRRRSKKEKKKKRKRSRSSGSSGSEDTESEKQTVSKKGPEPDSKETVAEVGSSVWKEPVQSQNNDEDKAIEVEIDDYFADMLA